MRNSMVDLEKLFYTFLNIKVNSYNKNIDVLELNATPEEVVYLLVYLRDNWGLNIDDYYGNFSITFNYIDRYLNETCYNN